MATYQERPRTVEAITFEELVEHGLKAEGANIVEGVPWSFGYRGLTVTHETDDCYQLSFEASKIFTFRRGEVLVSPHSGFHYACPVEVFEKSWQRVPEVFQLEPSEFVTGTFEGIEAAPSTEREPEAAS